MTTPVFFEPFVSDKQVAEFLNVHPKTVQRKARAGEIPGYRKLDKWFFLMSEIQQWMKGE